MKIKYLFIFLFCFIISFSFAGNKVVLNSSAFNGLKAREIGPAVMGGRITTIEGVKNNPNILYVGTAGGGLWKSLNGGTTFTPIFDKYTMSIGSIAIDPKNSNTIWVGTGEINVRNTVSVGTGLYRTTDGGINWEKIGFENSERISKIIIDPTNSKIIYVAVLGHLWNDSKERGLYKSIDNGKTWKKILYVDEKTGCNDMEIDPQRPNIIYASMWQFRRKPYFFTSGGKGSNLYRSEDGGKTWKIIRKGLPKGILGRISIAIAPSRPGTLYANVEAKKKSGLYVSYDMGENWKFVNGSNLIKMRPFYFSHLVVDPKDFRRLYVTGLVLSTSKNGGKTFSFPFSMGEGVHPDLHAIWINPGNTKQVFVGCDGGVYRSNNYGKQFEFLSNLPVSQFYHVYYDLDTPYNVYGGLQDNGAWYGPSKSYSAFGIQNKDWKNVGGGDGFYVFPHPKNPNIIYYSWQGGELMRYNQKTKETKSIKPLRTDKNEPKYRFNWNAGVALSPHNPDTIYIGAQFLFKSTNRGDTWTKISPDLTTNDPKKQQQDKSGGLTIDNTTAENHCSIITISESPLDENLIWVGTDDGNLQITTDGGKSWTNVVKNIKGLPPHTWCSSVETSRFKKGRAYVTFDGHRTGDMKTYVYKTEDYGKTWYSLTTSTIKGYSHIVREDIKKENLLFLGTEFGLYISINGGENWARVKSVPKVAVRDIQVHPKTNDLILATHGRGIMIIDDITPLRALTDKILNSKAAILPSRPTYMSVSTYFQEFPGNGEFFGENPPEGAMITYYLKKRHIFGDLKIEILNSKGKLIQELPGSKSKGINRIYWGMRLKPPKMGTTPGLSISISEGPMVPEGTYTIKLVKNGKSYEGKIELLPDIVAKHSSEDRKIRTKAIMKLYNMLEDIGFISDNTSLIIKRLKEIEKRKKYKKLIGFKKKLISFHKTIINYGGMMTEAKLQGKISGLYSSIMMYGGKPTDSQIYNIDVLNYKVNEAKKRYAKLIKELPKINNFLKKKKIKTIKLKTREEYNKRK